MIQKESLVIKDREVLKELVDITRQNILKALMHDPLTAEEIADKVDFPQKKIYYHLKKLESVGVIQSKNVGIVNGINQKQYLSVASSIIVKVDMLDPSSDHEDKNFLKNLFLDEHTKVMSLVDRITGFNEKPTEPVLRTISLNIPKKKYREFAVQLKQITDQLRSAEVDGKKSDTVSVHLDLKFFMIKKSSKKD
jgi:predicted transcriptional regulator|tara:strand:+ start:549 stop:1130 length:582 start_codon:yes stop_codon:yes gene_type:complete